VVLILQRQVAKADSLTSSDIGRYLCFGVALESVTSGFTNDLVDLSLQY
jgi:hypothetical protein